MAIPTGFFLFSNANDYVPPFVSTQVALRDEVQRLQGVVARLNEARTYFYSETERLQVEVLSAKASEFTLTAERDALKNKIETLEILLKNNQKCRTRLQNELNHERQNVMVSRKRALDAEARFNDERSAKKHKAEEIPELEELI